jgi:hypothetical protein
VIEPTIIYVDEAAPISEETWHEFACQHRGALSAHDVQHALEHAVDQEVKGG